MKFAQPEWLYIGAAIIVALLALLYRAAGQRRQKLRMLLAADLEPLLTANLSPSRRLLKQIILVAGAAAICVTLARPQYGYVWQEMSQRGVDLLIAVDTSKSMLTPDVKPDRLTRAKLAVTDLVTQNIDARMGLIAFAGSSFLQCPLTTDLDSFMETLQALDSNVIPVGGSNLAGAIDEAIRVLGSSAKEHRSLILITDGEDLSGQALEAARHAEAENVKIYAIGVGTPEGELIPFVGQDGQINYVKDEAGKPVRSRLDEKTLREIAKITGGQYSRLNAQENGLEQIWKNEISKLPEKEFNSKTQKIPLERFQWPLAVAIGLLMVEFFISERKRNYFFSVPWLKKMGATKSKAPNKIAQTTSLLILCLVSGNAHGAIWGDSAERAYKKGDYSQAYKLYSEKLKSNPSLVEQQYNAGAAAYKNGQYQDALRNFEAALPGATPELQQKAYYNQGNAYYRIGEKTATTNSEQTISQWEKSIAAYEHALELNPNDADAKYNLELVKNKLEQLKQKQQQQDEQSSNKDDKSKDDKSKDDKSKPQDKNQNEENKDNKQSSDKQDKKSQDKDNKSNSQKSDSKQGDDKKDKNQNASDKSGEQQNKSKPQQGGQNSQTREPRSAQKKSEDGKMDQAEAEAMLDAAKGDEKILPVQSGNMNKNYQQQDVKKDW